MALIGYARVSTGDQTFDLQKDALTAAGCIDIYDEYALGHGCNVRRWPPRCGPVGLGIRW